jgi:predicted lipid-binding transport protein (Tim44 family)
MLSALIAGMMTLDMVVLVGGVQAAAMSLTQAGRPMSQSVIFAPRMPRSSNTNLLMKYTSKSNRDVLTSSTEFVYSPI